MLKFNELMDYIVKGVHMRIVEEVIGKEVLDSSAAIIGKVKDVEVNLETNEIEAFVLGKGGISEGLGISKGETIVPFDMVSRIGDKVLLKSGLEKESFDLDI